MRKSCRQKSGAAHPRKSLLLNGKPVVLGLKTARPEGLRYPPSNQTCPKHVTPT
jgi:hypothetical protein